MSLEEYFDSLRIGKLLKKDLNRRSFIMSKIDYLTTIGVISIKDGIIREKLIDGTFRVIDNSSEITLAIHEVSDQRDFRNANRFLYSILKVQAHFNDFEQLLPHTINMLSSLNYLDFHYFPFFHISHWKDDTNEMASYILPYEIACGELDCHDFYTRLRARIEGYTILKYYYYESGMQSDFSPHYTKDYLDVLLFGFNGSQPIMESILTRIYQNTDAIIHCDDSSYILNIYSESHEKVLGRNDKFHYMIFPEVSLIYACYLMGDEEVSTLFNFDLYMIKKHTINVYQDYYSIINN